MAKHRFTGHWYPLPILFSVTITTCVGCGGESSQPDLSAFKEGLASFKGQDFEKATASFTKAIDACEDFAQAYYFRGRARHEMGDRTAAIDDYTQAIEVDDEIIKTLASSGEEPDDEYWPKRRLRFMRSSVFLNRGTAHNALGNWDAAIDDFTTVMRLGSENAEAYSGRGAAFLAKGFPKVAEEDLAEAIRLKPSYGPAYTHRAAVYLQQGDDDAAIQDCNQAIRLDPTDTRAYHLRGQAYLKKNRYDRAIADLEEAQTRLTALEAEDASADESDRAAQIKEDLQFARELKSQAATQEATQESTEEEPRDDAVANGREKDSAAAERHYDKAVEHTESQALKAAIRELDKAIRLDANFADAYLLRGELDLKRGFPDTALEDLKDAAQIAGPQAEILWRRGQAYLMLGNHQKSVDDCTEAIRAQSDCAEAYFYRGLAKLAGSHYYRAIVDLEEAQRLDQSLNDSIEAPLAKAYFHWSKVLAKRGDAAAAATAMQESRLLDATYVDRRPAPYTFDDGTLVSADRTKPYEVLKYIETAPHGLGMKYLAAKEYDQAIDQLTLAIHDNPYDYPAYLARGKAFLARELAENAIDDFDKIVRKQQATAEVYVLRARAYAMIKEHRLSRDDATQAIQLTPDYAPAFRVRGEAYLERGKYGLAIRDFDEAIGFNPELKAELDPLLAKARYRRAAAGRESGSETAAVRDLLRARESEREGS